VKRFDQNNKGQWELSSQKASIVSAK